MELLVRPARPHDTAAGLLYESARPYYDAYAGDEGRARALLGALYPRRDHAASFEVCAVAEVAGAPVGVLAGFPVAEGDRLARRFVSLTFGRLPPWRWPAVVRHLRAAGAVAPRAPVGAWYVDALAVDPAWQRRGVATRLLAEAEAIAGRAGLRGVAVDTGLANAPARALYEAYGFRERDVRHAPDPHTARMIGGPGFVSYFKATT